MQPEPKMKTDSHGFVWLYEVHFNPPRKQIGQCHFSGGDKGRMTELKSLKIFKHKDGGGYWMLYDFVNGGTDSFEDSIDELMQEADTEFGVKRSEWKEIKDES